MPPRARAKLTDPVFWELFLESVNSAGEDSTTAGVMVNSSETISYVMTAANIFQLKGIDEPPALSGGAARAAQAALEGCPAHLVPEVLSSFAGVESFAELKRRQLRRRAANRGAMARDDVLDVFVCEHRFIPW